jgi:hypothetical protein
MEEQTDQAPEGWCGMSDSTGLALHKLAVLGEIAGALRDARMANNDSEIPVTWLGWFGDMAYRIAMDAGETVTPAKASTLVGRYFHFLKTASETDLNVMHGRARSLLCLTLSIAGAGCLPRLSARSSYAAKWSPHHDLPH